jgi:hypothetical protein
MPFNVDGSGTETEHVSSEDTAEQQFGNLLDLGREPNPAVGVASKVGAERAASGEEPEEYASQDSRGPADEGATSADVGDNSVDDGDGSVFEFTINGEKREVTQRELQDSFMFQSDYTRKTQQLAEQRKQFHQHAEAVVQERQQYAQLLGALEQHLNQLQGAEPDWATLVRTDPIEYQAQRAMWDQRQQQLRAAQQEQQRVMEQNQREYRARVQTHMQTQRDALLQARPDLRDSQVAQRFQVEIMDYANKSYGFTPQDIGSLMDHRVFLVLDKARQFDMLQAAGTQKAVKVKQQPTMRPGSAKGAQTTAVRKLNDAKKRLRASGDIRDASAAFETLL